MGNFERFGCYLLTTDRYAAEGFHRGLIVTLLDQWEEDVWEAEATAADKTFTVRDEDLAPLPTHARPYFHPDDVKEVIYRAIARSDISQANRQALKANVDGSTLTRRQAPMFLDLSEGPVTDRATDLPNGPLSVRAHHLDGVYGNYLGEYLFWVTDGRIDCIEYAWVADDPPTVWPWAETILFEPPAWATADLTVEIYPEFLDRLRGKGFSVGSRSALMRFHRGYVGMLIQGIYPVPGHQHYRVRIAIWNDFDPPAVCPGALFVLWCGDDFGRGQVL